MMETYAANAGFNKSEACVYCRGKWDMPKLVWELALGGFI